MKRDSFCNSCGNSLKSQASYPKKCNCGLEVYSNPIPVVSAIVPVKQSNGEISVLLVRRNIEPQKGKLCLPGGYAETGYSWQAEMVREVVEETTLILEPKKVVLQDVQSTSNFRTVSIFGVTEEVDVASINWKFSNSETQELVLFTPSLMDDVAFPTHKENIAKFLSAQKKPGVLNWLKRLFGSLKRKLSILFGKK